MQYITPSEIEDLQNTEKVNSSPYKVIKKQTYDVIQTVGLLKHFGQYKNALKFGSITMKIQNGKPKKEVDLAIHIRKKLLPVCTSDTEGKILYHA